jgi:hypothetical protein
MAFVNALADPSAKLAVQQCVDTVAVNPWNRCDPKL